MSKLTISSIEKGAAVVHMSHVHKFTVPKGPKGSQQAIQISQDWDASCESLLQLVGKAHYPDLCGVGSR